MTAPIWTPDQRRRDGSELTLFSARAGLADSSKIYRWSTENPAQFWSQVWDQFDVVGEKGDRLMVHGDEFHETRFFPDATLNFAENLLRRNDDSVAVVARGEHPTANTQWTWTDLNVATARIQQALHADGVKAGDRVAAWMPNIPHTLAVMLAAASIGAVFSSASPDFGVDGVVDRFGQIAPTVLVACDGYSYNGKIHDRLVPLADAVDRLPSVRRVVVVPFLGSGAVGTAANAVLFDDWVAPHPATKPEFVTLPFDHPLYILFSSGTTGKPKCIVHRAGGILLKHLVEHRLHSDVHSGDRVFYFTTTGWMMWNWLVSGLAAEATIVLYDGSPFYPDGNRLFDIVDEVGVTLLGVSAKFIESLATNQLRPVETHSLSTLRTICSTGSPLVPEGFETIYNDVKADVHLASISGGTDLCGCLVAGNPNLAVWAGEIQGPGFGMAIDVVDDDGQSLPPGVQGELICRSAFPSMPIGFQNDPGHKRYRAAYFERVPGAWHQGDYAELTEHGGIIIHGRSDATLNPGGVRIGTAEIYRQVQKVTGVVESVVIGQTIAGDTRVVLFVVLADGLTLDEDLRSEIRTTIRRGASPRHVPEVIAQVTDIPRTRSGKIAELAVRSSVEHTPISNTEALANPEALEQFAAHPDLN